MEVVLRFYGAMQIPAEFAAEGIKLVLPDVHGIPSKEVGVVIVNGFLVGKNRTLNDQEDVNLYPPLEDGRTFYGKRM